MRPVGVKEGITQCGETIIILLGFWHNSTRQMVSWLCVAWFVASIHLQTVLSRSWGGKGQLAPNGHNLVQGYRPPQRRAGQGKPRLQGHQNGHASISSLPEAQSKQTAWLLPSELRRGFEVIRKDCCASWQQVTDSSSVGQPSGLAPPFKTLPSRGRSTHHANLVAHS